MPQTIRNVILEMQGLALRRDGVREKTRSGCVECHITHEFWSRFGDYNPFVFELPVAVNVTVPADCDVLRLFAAGRSDSEWCAPGALLTPAWLALADHRRCAAAYAPVAGGTFLLVAGGGHPLD